MTTAAPTPDAPTRTALERALKGFTPKWTTQLDLPFSSSHNLDNETFRIPRILQWLCQEIIGAKDGGRWEKTAWRYWFQFGDLPFSLAFEKFGLRLYGSANSAEEFGAAAKKVMGALDKASRMAERKVFQGFADQQVRSGAVTVRNEFPRLRNMYEEFRQAAETGPPERPAEERQEGSLLESTGIIDIFEKERHRFHYTVAMLTAYFGWLEHALVLFWPFLGFQPGTDDLEGFIGDRWGDKFKQLFDPATDPIANGHLAKLKETCEEFRNTFAHGGFGRHRRNLLVHVAGGGPIEAGVSWVRGRPHFDFFPVPEESYADIVKVLDGFDAWLKIGPARYGWQWGEAGIDLPCDLQYVQEIADAISAGGDAFVELLSKWSYISDQAANMDW